MLAFTLRRLIYSVLVIFGVVTVVFLIMNLLPDPARMMQGQRADLATQAAIRHQLGLDLPAWQRYIRFIGDVAQGDLGRSWSSNRPVLTSIWERFGATATLSISAMVIATILGIGIGIVSAVKSYSLIDNASMIFALVGISVPAFVMGLLAMLLFGAVLDWLPVSGYMWQGDELHIEYLILPMFVLALRPVSIIARVTRSSMLETLSSDYVRTAKAKGVSWKGIVYRHALRNALNPVVTTVSAWLAGLLVGTYFIEYIFNWPGIGLQAVDAILRSDFPLIQGTVIFSAAIFVVVNFIVDILYARLDPRVKLS
ncbi:MAG: ABC transporter permease [Bacteroidota bacterium]|nr:ABC transporter permease [Bacteroidota bacterium]MDP4232636.1 ABC transporter permease [Bacteroidota bacterium]MDP4243888.1 ABC transporter permease [Bacteroidota bacterium]MDP4288443.1 ABC transporter permease [Bacteroidota bacterium]